MSYMDFVEGADGLTLGQYLKLARKKIGISQQKLGEIVGMSSRVIGRFEKDEIFYPKPQDLIRIAQAMHLDMEELIIRAGYQFTHISEDQRKEVIEELVISKTLLSEIQRLQATWKTLADPIQTIAIQLVTIKNHLEKLVDCYVNQKEE